MYVHMYACMHACMYVCMYECMYVHMYACMHVCMYVCMNVCMCICTCACVRVCMYECMCVHYVRVYPKAHRLYTYVHVPACCIILDIPSSLKYMLITNVVCGSDVVIYTYMYMYLCSAEGMYQVRAFSSWFHFLAPWPLLSPLWI